MIFWCRVSQFTSMARKPHRVPQDRGTHIMQLYGMINSGRVSTPLFARIADGCPSCVMHDLSTAARPASSCSTATDPDHPLNPWHKSGYRAGNGGVPVANPIPNLESIIQDARSQIGHPLNIICHSMRRACDALNGAMFLVFEYLQSSIFY